MTPRIGQNQKWASLKAGVIAKLSLAIQKEKKFTYILRSPGPVLQETASMILFASIKPNASNSQVPFIDFTLKDVQMW